MADIGQPSNLDERLTCQILKKHKERGIFLEFLRIKLSGGRTAFECMLQIAKNSTHKKVTFEETVEFVLSELKVQTNGLPSPYKSLVVEQISLKDSKMGELQDQLSKGKITSTQMPKEYPVIHNQAQEIVLQKIKEGVGEDEKKYVSQRKNLLSQMRAMSRELFSAVNGFGLSGEMLVNYLKILFELNLIEEAEQIEPFKLREQIAEALMLSEPIKLVHIKCLRFVYPKEGGVKMLTDTDDVVIDGVLGKYKPRSETNLFPKLLKIKNLIERCGVKTQFTICFADNDLELLFPQGNKFVDGKSLETAKQSAREYMEDIYLKYGDYFEFTTLNELSDRSQGRYGLLFADILGDIIHGKGKYVDPKFFERDRVNHQYEFYRKLFGVKYSRDEARRSVSAQLASTIAIKESLRVLGEKMVIIEDNRGGENKFIANSYFSVVFVKLRQDENFDIQ